MIIYSCDFSSYDVGWCVHCYAVKIAYDGDVFVVRSVVDLYAKCGRNGDARKVFDEMPVRNVVSCSSELKKMIIGNNGCSTLTHRIA
ncbi:putative pentatricopeptide [Helianthus annuus]|nr:putative pentatricopeptide [Helianthus annuus]